MAYCSGGAGAETLSPNIFTPGKDLGAGSPASCGCHGVAQGRSVTGFVTGARLLQGVLLALNYHVCLYLCDSFQSPMPLHATKLRARGILVEYGAALAKLPSFSSGVLSDAANAAERMLVTSCARTVRCPNLESTGERERVRHPRVGAGQRERGDRRANGNECAS